MKNLLGGGSVLVALVCGVASMATLYDSYFNENDWFQMLWTEIGFDPLSEQEARVREGRFGGDAGIVGILFLYLGYKILNHRPLR